MARVLTCAATLAFRANAEPGVALGVDVAPAGDAGLLVSAPDARGHGLFRARVVADHAVEPLVLVGASDRAHRVVEEQSFLHGTASLALFHRVLLSLDVPVALATRGEGASDRDLNLRAPAEAAALGDLRVGTRARVLGPAGDGLQLGVGLEGRIPTGVAAAYASDDALGGKIHVSVGARTRSIVFASEAFVRFRDAEALGGVLPTRVGTAVGAGSMVQLPLDNGQRYWIGTELQASSGVGNGARLLDPRSTLLSLLVVARARPLPIPVEVTAGFGPGLGRAAGSPDYRVLAAVGWVPEEPAPPPDADGDGVPDVTDICVRLPGVPAKDPLMHGCPEVPLDTDGDAVPDVYDACPRRPGIPTAARKTHGCPKADAPVEESAAPAEPRRSAPSAELVEERIEISEQVQFETGTAILLPESAPVLAAVARVLTEHPRLLRVEVSGHTDDLGTPESNLRLATERARAVLEWLVSHGIERARLFAVGYGETRPIADNSTESGRALNRRVEFRVVPSSASKPETK